MFIFSKNLILLLFDEELVNCFISIIIFLLVLKSFHSFCLIVEFLISNIYFFKHWLHFFFKFLTAKIDPERNGSREEVEENVTNILYTLFLS